MSNSVTPPARKSVGWFLRQQFRAWAKFHKEMANGLWYRVLVRSNTQRFCTLYNARARLKGVDVRARFDPETQRCTVASADRTVEAYPPHRALNYANGIEARAAKLGADYLLQLLEFADGDVVIDCGANVGDLKLYFGSIGAKVEYVAIEPGPGEFAALQRNIAPSIAHNVGLWNEDGELTFYISSKGADSSLIEPPSYESVSKVPVRRLDTLVDFPRIKLLKVEAEGAEPEVLEGSLNILERIDYISADLAGERGINLESTLAPVTNFLVRHGFDLVALNPKRIAALYRNTRLS